MRAEDVDLITAARKAIGARRPGRCARMEGIFEIGGCDCEWAAEAAIAAVAPLIAKAERERQAVALVDIAKTYREIAACPDWTRKVRDGHKVAAEAFEGRAAAIRALPDGEVGG